MRKTGPFFSSYHPNPAFKSVGGCFFHTGKGNPRMAFVQIIIGASAVAALYALMALSLAIVLHPMRVFHAALGGIFMVAAYITGLVATRLELHWMGGAVTAIIVSLGLGIAMEFVVYRPLFKRRASALPVAISSFATYFVLVNTFALLVGNQHIVIPRHSILFSFGSIVISGTQIAIVICGLIVFVVLSVGLSTHLGKAIRAMEDSPELLRTCGWNIGQVRSACILISSLLGGFGGVLTALDRGIEPNMGMPILLNGLVVVVATGSGAYRGLFVVALGLAILQALLGYMTSPRWSIAVSFAVLTAFLVFRPSGLFSISRRAEELS
jgi:branched-subunit amino acid ABC-type transport system permease component